MKPKFVLLILLLAFLQTALHGASLTRGEADQAYDRGDYSTAFRLFLAGAKRGDPEAQRKLGYFYMNGLGIEKDERQGRIWIETAAEQGNAEAQYNLGAVYYDGMGIPVDYEMAFKWLSKAATNGIVDAQAKLGEMYANGTGTTADDIKAGYWYGNASKRGHALASDKLLELKMSGRLADSEYEKILTSLESSAKKGDPRAQSRLGAVYCNGLGVSADSERCKVWLREAAEGGDVAAQRNLGILLMNWQGRGAPGHQLEATMTSNKDGGPAKTTVINHDRGPQFTEAVHWFERAARQFDSESLNNLGLLYSQGFGTEKDVIEGYKWWLLSAAQGSMEARSNITRARALLSEEQRQEAQRRAAAFSDPYASTKSAASEKAVHSDVDEPLPARKPNDKFHAIVIGVENYRAAGSGGIAPAMYAERDARVMRDYLPSLGYPERNTIYLAGEDATRSGIQKYLDEWLPKNVDVDSTVFFYFAGTGSPDPVTGEPYLLPWDGNTRSLKTTAYSRKDLQRTLERLHARRVTVVLDAGFSGTGSRSVSSSSGRPLVARVRPAEAPPSTITLLTAAQDDQTVGAFDDQGHGLFTYFFLKALRDAGKPPPKRITVGGLHGNLKPLVEAAARQKNREQTPVLSGPTTQELVQLSQ